MYVKIIASQRLNVFETQCIFRCYISVMNVGSVDWCCYEDRSTTTVGLCFMRAFLSGVTASCAESPQKRTFGVTCSRFWQDRMPLTRAPSYDFQHDFAGRGELNVFDGVLTHHLLPHLSFFSSLFRLHRSTTYIDAACCYRPSSVLSRSVCLSVCLSLCLSDYHTSESCKNGWTHWDTIWVEDSGGPREPLLDGAPDSPIGMGNFERERGATQRSSVQKWLNRSKCRFFGLWARMGPRNC